MTAMVRFARTSAQRGSTPDFLAPAATLHDAGVLLPVPRWRVLPAPSAVGRPHLARAHLASPAERPGAGAPTGLQSRGGRAITAGRFDSFAAPSWRYSRRCDRPAASRGRPPPRARTRAPVHRRGDRGGARGIGPRRGRRGTGGDRQVGRARRRPAVRAGRRDALPAGPRGRARARLRLRRGAPALRADAPRGVARRARRSAAGPGAAGRPRARPARRAGGGRGAGGGARRVVHGPARPLLAVREPRRRPARGAQRRRRALGRHLVAALPHLSAPPPGGAEDRPAGRHPPRGRGRGGAPAGHADRRPPRRGRPARAAQPRRRGPDGAGAPRRGARSDLHRRVPPRHRRLAVPRPRAGRGHSARRG